jgi:hypothetical protein
MSKTYSYAGVSRLEGELKVRFANDSFRVKVLAKNGHRDIDLIELKHPMTKEAAVQFLVDIDFATRDGVTNEEVKAAIEAALTKRTPKPKAERAPRAASEAKPKASKKSKPTMADIEAKAKAKVAVDRAAVEQQLADMEDAPF